MNFIRLIKGPMFDGHKTLAQITAADSVGLDENKLPDDCPLKSLLKEKYANLTFLKNNDNGCWHFKLNSHLLGQFRFHKAIREKNLFDESYETSFWSSVAKQIRSLMSVEDYDEKTAVDFMNRAQYNYKGNPQYTIREATVGFYSYDDEEAISRWEELWSKMTGGVSNPLVALIMKMGGRLDYVTYDCCGKGYRLQNSDWDIWETGIENLDEFDDEFFTENAAMLHYFFSHKDPSPVANEPNGNVIAEWVRNSLLVFPDDEEEEEEKEEEEKSNDNRTLECKICMARQCNAIFSPCNHIIACFSCASKTDICPLCRGQIEKFSQCFFG